MAFKPLKPIHYLIIFILFFVVIIGISAIFITFSNPFFGKQTNIVNLSTYIKGHESNKDTVERIKYNLYNTISQNIDDSQDAAKIKDVTIRDGTFSQKYDDDTTIYSVYFIVDSESLKQTYQVAYEWSKNPDQQLNEWGTYVKCPTKNQLIYEDFNCQDMFTEMNGTTDPNAQLFPQYGDLYEIWANIESEKIESLEIKIYSCVGSITDIAEENARNWLDSQGINEYPIEVSYCNL